jgi:hypothetical protein
MGSDGLNAPGAAEPFPGLTIDADGVEGSQRRLKDRRKPIACSPSWRWTRIIGRGR